MSSEDMLELIREYPLFEGWYASLPSLQEPANYGIRFEIGIYEEQVKSGYRLPLYLFSLHFLEHYHMVPGQLVPNGWKKLVGLIYLVQTSGYKLDATDFMRVFFEICFVKGVANCPGWYYIHSRQRLLKGGLKSNKGKPTPNNLTKHILSHIKLRGRLSIDEPLSEQQLEWAMIIPQKSVPSGDLIPLPPAESILLGEEERKATKRGVAPAPKKTRTTPPDRSPLIVERVSTEKDPIFRPRWTLRCDDIGMPDSQISEQHLVHGVLPRDKEKRDAVKEAKEATLRVEELNKQEADHLAQIETLERRLEWVKRKAAEEVKKARDQEWLKKRIDDGLEIYELGFMKAKEMFAECFPDISLGDFVMPAVVSPFGETVMPSEARDAAASYLPEEGPSGNAPKP
ncbi:hypothetical protein RJ639_007500 [Escallonia herrerae]|uniref:Transposase (Putative), gypsy type n=1 Tax=Escallonia herrerae TaxID=1293975 RepID=A0AA88VX85_9ASTE|nr:hypothetical protein RJ639_007500 [Escallonia herrerae]